MITQLQLQGLQGFYSTIEEDIKTFSLKFFRVLVFF